MNSANPSDGTDDRSSDQPGQRRDEDGPSSLGSDRGGPTTLQGLLRRLGADLSDIFPGNVGTSHARLQQLRTAISTPDSDEQQIDALSELCEFLSVGTEESLVSFSVNMFVHPLVNLLHVGSNVEIKIYAARALTHMMEALPSSSSAIAVDGAAGPLCENLLSIEYIDLAEQSLSALHKLSIDYPQQIVSANGFQAVLSFIDFFSIGVQRVAASTACNLCRLPRSDAMEMISSVLPTMMRLLGSDDQRIREFALLGFTRLAEAFRSSSEKLETLCGENFPLIERVLGLIVPSSPPALSPQSYSSALRLLALLSRGSATLGLQILSTNSLILKLQSRLSSGSILHAVDSLALADNLLPDIVQEVETPQSSTTRSRRRRALGSTVTYAAVDTKRRNSLEQNPEPLLLFGRTLFVPLMNFYISSADSNARRLTLSVMSKFIKIASKDVLAEIITEKKQDEFVDGQKLNSVRFCPFVAALLGENSSRNEALVGLAMAGSALEKLPFLRDPFCREGVVHEIVRLAAYQVSPTADTENESQEGGNDSTQVEGGSVSTPADSMTSHPIEQSRGRTNIHDEDSVWTAVAALQRGPTSRSSRGNSSSGVQRLPSRPFIDFRFPSSHSPHFLVPGTARSILSKHLGANADGTFKEGVFQNSILDKLTNICNNLTSVSESSSGSKGYQALAQLVKLLVASEGLTVFEISKGVVMEALSAFLSPSDGELVSSRIATMVRCFNEDGGHGAFSSLVKLALGVLSSEEKLTVRVYEPAHGTGSSSVSAGLRQLAQPFKLRLRKAASEPGSASLRDYSHHVVLIEPLATMGSVQEFLCPKVRELDRSSGPGASGSTRNQSNRVGRADSDSGNKAGEDDAGNHESRGDGDEINREELDEYRYAVEEMFDMGGENEDDEEMIEDDDEQEHNQNHDPSDEEVSSGEEDVIEQDGAESEEHDHGEADSLDVEHLGASLPPYEVHHEHLGQAPHRGSSSIGNASREPGNRGGSASRLGNEGSRNDATFRSYAAALAGNIPRTMDRISTSLAQNYSGNELRRAESRQSPVQKLSFSLRRNVLAHECSILSAVIQSSADGRIGTRLWSEVHTLHYSKVRNTTSPSTTVGTNIPNSSREAVTESDCSVRRSPRLQENRGRVQEVNPSRKDFLSSEASSLFLSKVDITAGSMPIPRSSPRSDIQPSISATIDVLKQLHWIYYKMSENVLRLEGVPSNIKGLVEESSIEFVSHKLSAKLIRQLSDPLALCGGVVPNWCFWLAREATFLIPFETRRVLFQSTSLGVSRALHLLQTRTEIAGASSSSHRSSRSHRDEARIGRIQRQKVRVHRNRILESAIKVMNMYSAHSTVLEVEYFDEAGTGLGPTLEFYSLASREIQRVDLRLWRGNAVSKTPKSKQDAMQSEGGASNRSSKSESNATRSGSVKRRSRRRSQSNSIAGKTPEMAPDEEEPPAYVVPTGNGLYPSSLPFVASDSQRDASSKSTALFSFVGRLVGKAMIDGRLLDLRFSNTFSRLLLAYCRVLYESGRTSDSTGGRVPLSSGHGSGRSRQSVMAGLENIDREEVWNVFTSGGSAMKMLRDVDFQLASSLNSVMDMVCGGQGDAIPSLCLTFVLPGDDSIELINNGRNVEVDGKNAEEFVRRVVYHVLFGGVCQQAEALLRGLGELMDVTNLLAFRSSELELMLCGPSYENWNVEYLVQATRCDHGYSHESQSVLFLLQLLTELDEKDQQRFVLFATGSPALPIGGLKSLHPKLVIVRRTPEAGRSPDECLPTVMTCTNYLKLPDYSSFEIAKKQIMYAVREGQRSFHLS